MIEISPSKANSFLISDDVCLEHVPLLGCNPEDSLKTATLVWIGDEDDRPR